MKKLLKKLLTNILFVSVLCSGLKPQPIEATGKKSVSAIVAIAAIGFFGFRARKTIAKKVKNLKNVFSQKNDLSKEQSREEQEKLRAKAQAKADARFKDLFKTILQVCEAFKDNWEADKDNAKTIFKNGEYLSKEDQQDWNSRFNNIPFNINSGKKKIIKEFVDYCRDKLNTEITEIGGKKYEPYGYSRVIGMAIKYLDYLNQPLVSKENVTSFSLGIAATEVLHRFTDIPTRVSGLIKNLWPFNFK